MDEVEFARTVAEALDALPDDLRRAMSNVDVVVEEEPPACSVSTRACR